VRRGSQGRRPAGAARALRTRARGGAEGALPRAARPDQGAQEHRFRVGFPAPCHWKALQEAAARPLHQARNTFMSHEIVTRAEAGVSTISFNRLERKNSITGPMYAALAEALTAAATDPSIRVAVLQGHETVFSAGNDVGDFAKTPATDSE